METNKLFSDSEEFELATDGNPKLRVSRPLPNRVLYTPSESDNAEDQELEKRLVSSKELDKVLERIAKRS